MWRLVPLLTPEAKEGLNLAMPESNAMISREEYLLALSNELATKISDVTENAYHIPGFLVSVGWGPGRRGPREGNEQDTQYCWDGEIGADNYAQVFVSPVLVDDIEVAQALLHQMLHVLFGHAKHDDAFIRIARIMGFAAPFSDWRSAEPGHLHHWLDQTLKHFPRYATLHSPLQLDTRKKQDTPGKKAFCRRCGFTARLSAKHINIRKQFPSYFSHECPPGTPELPEGGEGGEQQEQDDDIVDLTPPPPKEDGDEGDGKGQGEGQGSGLTQEAFEKALESLEEAAEEAAKSELTCDDCGQPYEEGGDGWCGLCPSCADKAEEEQDTEGTAESDAFAEHDGGEYAQQDGRDGGAKLKPQTGTKIFTTEMMEHLTGCPRCGADSAGLCSTCRSEGWYIPSS